MLCKGCSSLIILANASAIEYAKHWHFHCLVDQKSIMFSCFWTRMGARITADCSSYAAQKTVPRDVVMEAHGEVKLSRKTWWYNLPGGALMEHTSIHKKLMEAHQEPLLSSRRARTTKKRSSSNTSIGDARFALFLAVSPTRMQTPAVKK